MRRTLLLAIGLFGCAHTRGNVSSQAKATENGVTDLSPITCDTGETPITYGLVGSPAHPITLQQTGITGDGVRVEAGKNDYLSGIRFEICMDVTDKLRLKQIVHPTGTIGLGRLSYTVYKPDGEVRGLEKAVAEQDYSEIYAEIAESENPQYGHLLRGRKNADGYTFLTFSTYEKSAGPLTAIGDVTYGELLQGDPLVNFFKPNNRLIKVGRLSIELKYEYVGAPGMYVSYRFHSLKLKDSNQALPRPISKTAGEDQVNQFVSATQTHHSLLDTIVIKLPEATYVIGPTGAAGVTATYKNTHIQSVKFPLECQYVVECGQPLSGGGGGNGGGSGGPPPGAQ